MVTRIITSVVALAVLAGVLISPPVVFNIVLCAVILVMLHECYTSAKVLKPIMAAGFISSAAIMAALYESVYYIEPIWENRYIAPAVIFTVLLHLAVAIAVHGKSDYRDVLASGLLTIYITLSMGCLALTNSEYGTAIMIIVFVCAWSTDTGAYFTGRAFGKRKLIPHVSPNKTVAGAVGGVIISIVCCIIYLMIYVKIIGGTVGYQWPILVCGGAIVGGAAGILAQVGDLAASAIKRDTGVKDFGWIFPGHGGFMDRFDSVLYISPVIYFILQFMVS